MKDAMSGCNRKLNSIMKKYFFASILILSSFNFSSALVCTDLKVNLVKNNKGNNVLVLQNFLLEKGFLKATPNGYFGNGTFLAVKNYQKSIGLAQSGKVFPLTRESIKKDSCQNPSSNNKSSNQSNSTTNVCTMDVMRCPDGSYVGRSGPKCEFIACPKEGSVATSTPLIINTPTPSITSIDRKFFFENGIVDKGFTLIGNDFSTTSNNIYAVSRLDNKRYFIGSFNKLSGATSTIYASSSLSSDSFYCGTNCFKKLSRGSYDMYINKDKTDSNPTSFYIESFNINAFSGSDNTAIKASSTQVKIASIQFSPGVSVLVDSITIELNPETQESPNVQQIKSSHFGNFKFKDAETGQYIASSGSGTYTFTPISLSAYGSKTIDIYADVRAPDSGYLHATFGINVRDSLTNNKSKINSDDIHLTISKY